MAATDAERVIATIGHAGSSAERFFGRLRDAGIERVLDIRLRPASQFATFAHQRDLPYFLRELCGIDYEHDLRLAPTNELLDAYRSRDVDWGGYERGFLDLMAERDVPSSVDPGSFERKTALLCSEASPQECHRRLVAELLARAWGWRVEHLLSAKGLRDLYCDHGHEKGQDDAGG